MLNFFKKIKENKLYKTVFGKLNENLKKQTVHQKVKNDIVNLPDISEKLKDDKDFAIKLVKENPYMLNKFSEKLRNDKEFIKEACKENSLVFEYAGEKLKEKYPTIDKLFEISTKKVQEIIQNLRDYSILFKEVPKEYRFNKEIALEAVKINYNNTLYIPKALYKDDKDFAMELVRENPYIVLNLSERLQNDKDIIMETIKRNIFIYSNIQMNFKMMEKL